MSWTSNPKVPEVPYNKLMQNMTQHEIHRYVHGGQQPWNVSDKQYKTFLYTSEHNAIIAALTVYLKICIVLVKNSNRQERFAAWILTVTPSEYLFQYWQKYNPNGFKSKRSTNENLPKHP